MRGVVAARQKRDKARRTPKPSAAAAAQAALLEELKGAAARLGIRIREERLLREVGYRVRSGSCRVRDEEVLFLERSLPVSAQIDVLADELGRRNIDAIYLSPAARALLDRVAHRKATGHARQESPGR